jgi:hypothetical protein
VGLPGEHALHLDHQWPALLVQRRDLDPVADGDNIAFLWPLFQPPAQPADPQAIAGLNGKKA